MPRCSRPSHALLLRLYAEGLIDGVRVDHVDGLADPAGYCRKLRRGSGCERPAAPLISWSRRSCCAARRCRRLGVRRHHRLRLHGRGERRCSTTAAGEAPLTALWAALSGRPADFAAEEQAARREILARSFSAQLEACAARASTALTRDFTRAALRRALIELLVHFPVYRIYGTRRRPPAADRARPGRGGRRRAATCLADRPLGDRCRLAAPAVAERRRGTLRRGALPATQRAARREGGRGHRLLSLRPAALAQRCRLRRRALRRSTPPTSMRRMRRAPRPTSRTPCWPPRRTTTSAARTCARGSRC